MSVPVQQALAQLAATQQNAAPLVTQEFTYTMVWANVATGVQATAQLLIDAASSFLIVSQCFLAIDLTTTLAIATDPLLQLTDSGSSSTLFNVATPINSVAGNGTLPFLLPQPRLFSANSTITGTLTTQTVANNTSYYLSFNGLKIWK